MYCTPPPPIHIHMHRLVTASSKVQLLVQSQVTLFSTSYGSATFDLQHLVACHGGNSESVCVLPVSMCQSAGTYIIINIVNFKLYSVW